MVKTLLGVISVAERGFDISINTEIWDIVILWASLWWLEGCSELVLEIFLGLLKIGLSSLDISVNSEVWNVVINWVSLWSLE